MQPINLMKLVVGLDSLEAFKAYQETDITTFEGQKAYTVHTRNMPKQAEDILKSGGSIYRIIKGTMCCRQKIIGFDQFQTPKGKQTIIYTQARIIETQKIPMRAFQGWRYLKPENTPADLADIASGVASLTHEQEDEMLKDIGIL